MGQVLVRNLDDAVIARLKAKAKAEKISVEELARRALRDAVRPTKEEAWAEIDRIRAMSKPSDFDSTQVIRDGRDRGWVVIDASVAVKWFLEEDRSAQARSVLAADDDLFAPALVVPEVVQALWIAARHGRTSPDSAPAAIGSLNAVFSELSPDLDLIEDAVGLMRSLQHPIYDCLYLALGRRSKWPVLTADERLFAAGRRARIPVRLL